MLYLDIGVWKQKETCKKQASAEAEKGWKCSKDFHYRLVIMYKTPVIILTLFSSKVNLHSKKTYFSQYACLFCRFSRFFQYFILHNFIVYAKFDSIFPIYPGLYMSKMTGASNVSSLITMYGYDTVPAPISLSVFLPDPGPSKDVLTQTDCSPRYRSLTLIL